MLAMRTYMEAPIGQQKFAPNSFANAPLGRRTTIVRTPFSREAKKLRMNTL
jgi:hypothetical protein